MGGAGDDLKKDFKNIVRHFKRTVKDFIRSKSKKYTCERKQTQCGYGPRRNPRRFMPFCPFNFRSPIMLLLYPKIAVAILILIALLLCGVSLYGLIVILLLIIVFILI